jgi:excisionase family DNA binding protein
METIKPAEAAKALGVTSQTVRNYVREGRLDSVPTPGGHNRITVESLDRLKAGSPVSEPSAVD